ncbi:hypothetical protein B0H12DRAFT_1120086 [Mycena haematopus]|nr:hypothetical protein B0H12DRAFT_1120086 [Mycena haematopus]
MYQRPRPISPSASPVHNSFFPAPYRIAGAAPSPKRQRCSSARASTSAAPDDDLQNQGDVEREASALRMFDVWSQLAQKYSRRIDEDDIVDLVTGEIVKDRGVLNAEPPWQFPRFVDVDDASSTGTEDDEDDVDELDAFAGQVSVQGWTVPPARDDPADAKDLEEYIEAEKRRREEYGDEETSEVPSEFDENQDDGEFTFSEDAADGAAVSLPSAPIRMEISESDDELDNWDTVDESNFVSPVKTTKDLEEIELFASSTTPARRTPKPSSSKKLSDHKRESLIQLQTPPQSRTPSFVDEVPTPVSFALSPAPPLPPLQLSSRTKPKAGSKAVEPALSQVRTRSQSRGRSPPKDSIQESIKLDPVDVRRGRSVSRSARTSLAKAEESVRGTKASKKLDSPTAHRSAKSKMKLPPPSSNAIGLSPKSQRRASAAPSSISPLRASSQQLPRAESGRGKDGDRKIEPSVRGRKGKGKEKAVGQPFVDVQEESNDPFGSPPSFTLPSERGNHRHRPSATAVPRENQGGRSHKEERPPLPRPPDPLPPRSTKKRKRKALSFDSENSPRRADSNDAASHLFDSPPAQNKTRPLTSREPSDNSDGGYLSESKFEVETQRAPSHSHSHPGAIPPYYPPSFYPYHSYSPSTDGHPAIPCHDPRAQYIISQAMAQLSTLFTAPWSAQPFTPPRHSSARTPRPSPYLHPHHPDAHPYSFNSGPSAGTLPPSSPPSSSSPSRSHSDGRRGSLVSRSYSRGRRVSFEIDHDLGQNQVEAAEASSHSRQEMERASDNNGASYKGKKQMRVANLSETKAEAGLRMDNIKTRSGVSTRAQTPGPRAAVSRPAPTIKPKGKTRRTS